MRILSKRKSSKKYKNTKVYQEAKADIRYVRLIRFYIRIVRIKKEKGIWWMPWRLEAKKDVALCEKSRGDESNLWSVNIWMGEPTDTVSIFIWIHRIKKRTMGTETSKYHEERKSNETPRVVASEIGLAKRWDNKNRKSMERLTLDSDSLVRVESCFI